MNTTLTAVYLLVQLTIGSGTASATIPFRSLEACEAAMKNMGKFDLPGSDPRPMYCFDTSTGEVVGAPVE